MNAAKTKVTGINDSDELPVSVIESSVSREASLPYLPRKFFIEDPLTIDHQIFIFLFINDICGPSHTLRYITIIFRLAVFCVLGKT